MANSNSRHFIVSTREFWNANPCDGQTDIDSRMRFRYLKDVWLPSLLCSVACYPNILEIGCGQGTDMIFICQRMNPEASYVAIDLSEESLERASLAVQEKRDTLRVIPSLRMDNAEKLSFCDQGFDCVFSMGALHHTPDTRKAVGEIFRVLKPGGTAFIGLYRTYSPKIMVAIAIRKLSAIIDLLSREDRLIYRQLIRPYLRGILGSNLHELFGVPILKSYTRKGLMDLFSKFQVKRIYPVGTGIPNFYLNKWIDAHANPLGYVWIVECTKPL